jgi:hypothetical protein
MRKEEKMSHSRITLDGGQLSPKLADLVVGIHVFDPKWDHQQRVMAVSGILAVYETVRQLGDIEHTGDWDFRITVEAFTGGRTITLGTSLDDHEDERWGDWFRWPESYSIKPNDYTTGFAAWKFIEVEEFPSYASDEPKWKAVSVDHITRIAILFA